MNVFDLFAKLSLDTSQYEKGLKGASGQVQSFAQTVDKTVKRIATAILTGAAVKGMVNLGKAAVQTGMNFDKSMSQVAATMGKTNEEIQDLRKFALKMGSETAFSASQAADALNYMALAGYDADTAMSMLPGVLNLAAAGNMDLARASDMVTDSQSALGLSLDETNELIDKMAMASSKSNTSVEQLGDAILTVGGTAKNLNGGTTELATALGILADNGIKGAEGGTALRNILLALTVPTDVASKKLKELGVNVYDDQGHMRSLNDIFGELDESMANLTEQQRMDALSTIFNGRDLKSAEALLANNGERWNELSGYIDDAAGSAQKMADTQLDNLNGDITLMKSAAEGAKIAFSDGITPALRKIVQMVTRALSNPRTTRFLKDVGQKLGELAEKLAGKLANAIPKVINLFSNGAPKIKAFAITIGAAMLAVKALVNPVGALITSLGLLGAGFAAAELGADKYEGKLTAVQKAHHDTADACKESIERYNELVSARNDAIKTAHNEADATQDLWNEFKSLVDENGKVKQGYEDRAQAIANELSESTGQAITIVNGEVQEWEKLNGEIEHYIALTRARALVEAGEGPYKEALAGIADLDRMISDMEGMVEAQGGVRTGTIFEPGDKILAARLAAAKEQRDAYIETITRQEKAQALLLEGTDDALAEVSNLYSRDLTNPYAYLKTAETISQEELDLLNDTLSAAQKTRDRYAKDLENDPENAWIQQQIDSYEKQIAELEEIIARAEEAKAGGPASAGVEAKVGSGVYVEEGKKVTDDIASGVKDNGQPVVSSVKYVMNEAGEMVPQVMEPAGKEAIEAVADGMTENSDVIGDAVDTTLEDALYNEAYTLGLFGAEADYYVAQAMKENSGEVTSEASKMGTDAGTAYKEAFRSAAGGFWNAAFGWIGQDGSAGAIGYDYIPANNYPLLAHRGEMLLTASEADDYRRGGRGKGKQIVNNFNFHGVTQSDMDRVVAYVNRELVMG